jgi:hypothetical protein
MRTNIQYSMFSWLSEKKSTDSAFDTLFLRSEQDLFDRVVHRRLPTPDGRLDPTEGFAE